MEPTILTTCHGTRLVPLPDGGGVSAVNNAGQELVQLTWAEVAELAKAAPPVTTGETAGGEG